MKILIVTTGYPRNVNDQSGIFIKRLAMAMARSGAKITVLAPGDKHAKSRESDNGINIVRFYYAPRSLMMIGYGDGGIPENLRRWPWLFVIIPFFLLSMVIHAVALARECDVIHANWLHSGFFSLPAKIIRRKPLVVTLRGSDLRRGGSSLLSFVVSRANVVTTVNKKWADDLQSKFGCKVYYTPNGVESSRMPINPRLKFGISADEVIALYIGALRKVKGADLLSEIANITFELDQRVRFLVIGPGIPRQFGLDKLHNVICAGRMPPSEVLAIYPCCDIFILPSRSEGRPNALLEAMASGLPSVATRLPGVLEVLTDESGIVVDTEDSCALAKAIFTLSKDPTMRRIMGDRAKARIAELALDWDSSAKNYFCIFEEVRLCAGSAD